MGAIVTIKVPQGTDVRSLENEIKRKIENATGEKVSVALNIINTQPLPDTSFNTNLMDRSSNVNTMDMVTRNMNSFGSSL